MKHGDYKLVRIILRECDKDTACVQRDTWRKLHHWPMMRFGTFTRCRRKRTEGMHGRAKS